MQSTNFNLLNEILNDANYYDSDSDSAESFSCKCSNFKQISQHIKVCNDCSRSIDIEPQQVSASTNFCQSGMKKCIGDRRMQLVLNADQLRTQVEKILEANMQKLGVKLPDALIEDAFQQLKLLQQQRNIKGNNPRRVFIFCLIDQCSQHNLNISTITIFKLLDVKQRVSLSQGKVILQQSKYLTCSQSGQPIIQQPMNQNSEKCMNIINNMYIPLNFTEVEITFIKDILQVIHDNKMFTQNLPETKCKMVVALVIYKRCQESTGNFVHEHSNKLIYNTCKKCLIKELREVKLSIKILKDFVFQLKLDQTQKLFKDIKGMSQYLNVVTST